MNLPKILFEKCVICDIRKAHKEKTRCKPCMFKIGSDGAETSSILKNHNNEIEIGIPKPRFFYFLHHPELNWNFPPLPTHDLYGNETTGNEWWNIHHEDGNHCNDDIWNLVLLLNTEHHRIHAFERNPMDNVDIEQFKILIRDKYKERYLNNKNLDKNKIKYYKMIDWLNNIENGEYTLNYDLCKLLNYKEPYSLRIGINSAIENNEVQDMKLKHNGKRGWISKWVLIKEQKM